MRIINSSIACDTLDTNFAFHDNTNRVNISHVFLHLLPCCKLLLTFRAWEPLDVTLMKLSCGELYGFPATRSALEVRVRFHQLGEFGKFLRLLLFFDQRSLGDGAGGARL